MKLKFLAAFFLFCLPLAAQKDLNMAQHATGAFDVKISPVDPAFKFDENPIGRFSLDKHFHGDLEAASQGEMLSGGTPAKGSGGYVAIERVSGTFLLMHTGTMQNGAYQMNVTVVPGSGTAQLAGLSGSMQITIKDSKHSYDFSTTQPNTPNTQGARLCASCGSSLRRAAFQSGPLPPWERRSPDRRLLFLSADVRALRVSALSFLPLPKKQCGTGTHACPTGLTSLLKRT